MEVQVVRLPDYVDVELTGNVDINALMNLIRKLGEVTQAGGDKCLLFDLLSLGGDVHVAAQMQVGEQIAACLPHLQRVASVVATEKITRNSEQVARSHGLQMKVFDSKDEAIAWVRGQEAAPPAAAAPGEAPAKARAEPPPMDPVRAAIWSAVRHLFPVHAQAVQFPNGTLAISWSVANQRGAVYDMATPITIRLEPELVEQMKLATAEQRKRIAANQEAAFRAGLVGYDPYTSVPRARVIVLG